MRNKESTKTPFSSWIVRETQVTHIKLILMYLPLDLILLGSSFGTWEIDRFALHKAGSKLELRRELRSQQCLGVAGYCRLVAALLSASSWCRAQHADHSNLVWGSDENGPGRAVPICNPNPASHWRTWLALPLPPSRSLTGSSLQKKKRFILQY